MLLNPGIREEEEMGSTDKREFPEEVNREDGVISEGNRDCEKEGKRDE